LNEQELIFSLKNGEQQAFQWLVESRQDMVYNTLLGIVQNVSEAEDLAQEVFIQVYQSIGSFRGDAKLSTWIYRIAVAKAIDAERKKKTRKRFFGFRLNEDNAAEDPMHFEHPGILIENKERAALLFKALEKLPKNQRVAFLLIKTEGLSYEDTALVMKITIKAVEALMHRAKAQLRKILYDYYQQHS
jgi:RNA polymerase sigma-70 factor (ECF subfamily)